MVVVRKESFPAPRVLAVLCLQATLLLCTSGASTRQLHAASRQGAGGAPDCSRDEGYQLRRPEFQGYCKATWDGHAFFASAGGPLAGALPATAAADMRFFVRQLGAVADAARRKRGADFLATRCVYPRSSAHAQDGWIRGSFLWARALGLPTPPSHCLTAVVHAAGTARATLMHTARLDRGVEVAARTLRAAARAGRARGVAARVVKPWSTVRGDIFAEYENPVFRCVVRQVVGVRVQGAWRVPAGVTNTPLGVSRREGRRVHLTELLALGPRGQVRASRITAYEEGRGEAPRLDATTWVSRWGGQVSVTAFRKQPVWETPAIARLMDGSQRERALVQGTVFGSNVAILVLPICMTLVPVSYIEYVQTPMVFMYGAFTDVLSTLPLLVKGLELLALDESAACDSWVHGVETTDPNSTVIVETWCASCAPQVTFRSYGYAFIACSLFFMALGVSLEYYSRQRLITKMKRGEPLPRRFWSWAEEENPEMYRRKPVEKCALCVCGDDNMHVNWGSTRESYEKNAVTSIGWGWGKFFQKGG